MWAADATTIARVHVRTARVDASAARLRTSRLLSSASLRPPGMPSPSILIVKSMDDPFPGGIAAEGAAATRAGGEWERAVQTRLASLYARAARPRWGPVPPGAAAVVFADYAECLACLARDIAAHDGLAWWWRTWSPKLSRRAAAGWVDMWRDNAAYVPAALEQLVVWNCAVRVVESIAPDESWHILQEIVRVFAVPEVLTTHTRLADELAIPAASTNPERPPSRVVAEPTFEPTAELPPWDSVVATSEVPPSLARPRAALLGVALALRRAPQLVASQRFAESFHTWMRAPDPEVRRGWSRPGDRVVTSVARDAGEHAREIRDPEASDAAPSDPATEPPNANRRRRVIEDPAVVSPPDTHDAPELSDGAGIFYLIHVLRVAELTRFDVGSSAWALLELVARCLLGPSYLRVAGDGIWKIFAQLDGRAVDVPPGEGFRASACYRAPDSWLRTVDEHAALQVRYRRRRMELWHPAGVLVRDELLPAPRPTVPLTRLPRRARRLASIHPAALPASAELRRFLHFILPYVRFRLSSSLRSGSIADVLLRPGRIYLTATHVDVVMALNDISVPARMAGLDANPGWVPELGRVVTFHFV